MLDGINIFLTRKCNLRCPYCFVNKEDGKHMSLKTREQTLSFIVSNLDLQSPRTHIGYIGGEPLAAYDNFQFFTEKLKQINPKLNIGFTTNGVLLTEKKCEYILRHNLRTVVSMDGDRGAMEYRTTKEGVTVYDQVVKAIEMLKRNHAKFLVQMTVTPDNSHNLLHNVKSVAALGVEAILTGFVYEANWSHEQLSVLSDELNRLFSWYYHIYSEKKNLKLRYIDNEVVSYLLFRSGRKCDSTNCPIADKVVAVDVDGNIIPCQAFVDMPEWSVGTVEQGIDKRKQLLLHTSLEFMSCDACGLQGFCKKCPRCNYLICGDMSTANPVSCRINREFFSNLKWFTEILFQEGNERFLSEYGYLLDDESKNMAIK